MAQPKDPAGSGDNSAMRIDPALVRELAELLTDNELTEIEVEDGDRRIKVEREPAPVIVARRAGRGRSARRWRRRPMHAKEDLGGSRRKKSRATPSSRRWSAPPSCRPSPAPSRSSRSATR